ncbi:hypothetical protein QBC42DRAFT_173625 [Cladorrhinum samala]|uniref:F-box domain-containing protein n=1 Tax=Cladorrhinum samala TaxID=585594 RepID=A0AAV9HTS2_9PEZI|nr:hypothetical protein QBC42DRAFT_173625 [Cladorrhinum samala]
MTSSALLFYCLWQDDKIREKLFELLSKRDLCALRVANTACCNLLTRRLFIRINVTFTANTFTKPSRVQAFTRIAHHIEHLSFSFPHSNATFLPPLIHPQTGQEIMFLYNPHTSMESALTRPKYGNSELGEILTQQYPPLFHAASNVPSFINAIKNLTNIRHLTIKTPGQEPSERYRRDIVDYALISLRIAVERSPLTKLNKLSLSGVHPAAFNYLRYKSGFGTIPSAACRWQQIKKLYISVESWDFYGPSPGLDHLKIIDDYIRDFAPQLDKFAFSWIGNRGPCPIALCGDPLFATPRTTRKLFNEVTSPMSPLPPLPTRTQLLMPRLRCMAVRNATMNAAQLKDLIITHRDTVREFDFDNVALVRGGSWEEALAPLTRDEPEAWSRKSMASESSRPSVSRSNSTGSAVYANEEDLPTPSPAAEAASRELFEVDLQDMMFSGPNDMDAFEAGVEEWAMGVTASLPQQTPLPPSPNPNTDGYGSDLASDLEAARQATEGFSTKLLKRRKKRRTQHHEEEDRSKSDSRSSHKTEHKPSKADLKADRSRSSHKHSRSADDAPRKSSQSPSRHRRRHHHHKDHHHRRHHSDESPSLPSLPSMPTMPEVVGTDDESRLQHMTNNLRSIRPPTPPKSRPSTPGFFKSKFSSSSRPLTPPTTPPTAFAVAQSSLLTISIPIHPPSSFPVLLQPTVYDPSSTAGPFVPASPPANPDDLDLSPTQRSIEEDIKREEAAEAAARSSALKRAREAVMTKLSKEFAKQRGPGGSGGERPELKRKDSAAVRFVAKQQQQHDGGNSNNSNNNEAEMVGAGNGGSGGTSLGNRIREGLFGRGGGGGNVTAAGHGHSHHNHHHHGYGKGKERSSAESERSVTVSDGRGLESQSALVPLIFSRS